MHTAKEACKIVQKSYFTPQYSIQKSSILILMPSSCIQFQQKNGQELKRVYEANNSLLAMISCGVVVLLLWLGRDGDG